MEHRLGGVWRRRRSGGGMGRYVSFSIPEESIHIHIVLSGEEERKITVSWSGEAPVKITKEIENYSCWPLIHHHWY